MLRESDKHKRRANRISLMIETFALIGGFTTSDSFPFIWHYLHNEGFRSILLTDRVMLGEREKIT